MTTFARIVGGYAVDCHVAADLVELAARFHPQWFANHPFIIVPDGTKHGATDNGHGTFTNPPVPPVVLIDSVLDENGFIDYMTDQLGGGATGDARYGAILIAAKNTTDSTVATKFAKFNAAPGRRQPTKKLLNAMKTAALPAGSAVTTAEINAIDNNWPQV